LKKEKRRFDKLQVNPRNGVSDRNKGVRELDPLVLKAEIEELRSEMGWLIDMGASSSEIYKISVELDKLIVALYKVQSGKFA
jgi:hypothetical protein